MFEKVNPSHPDKVADRIAGAIVDLAYSKKDNPKIAVEVLIGHGYCFIIIESDTLNGLDDDKMIEIADIDNDKIRKIAERIAGPHTIYIIQHPQDEHLANNQKDRIRCGDNGIFKGMPVTKEQRELTEMAQVWYAMYNSDGKYIKDGEKLIICQSNADGRLRAVHPDAIINPLGDWTGGLDADSGATNRKLGSDMGDAVTGGGLHGKDLSKADVSVNIYAHLKAQETGSPVELCCAIGDETIDGRPYEEIVEIAREYIKKLGGFEKFAEWGLIR